MIDITAIFLVVLAAGLVRLVVAAVRFARHPAKLNYPSMWRARLTWRWLARHCNPPLAYVDQHRRAVSLPGRTSVRIRTRSTSPTDKLRYPRARFTPTVSGWEARVRTIPHVGRPELEDAAGSIADHWKVARVSISQPKPGRIVVHGHRVDPLVGTLTMADAPASQVPRMLWLGRDEHGTDRFAEIANVPGIAVGGMPGAGTSTELTAWQAQMAPSPVVQFVNLDGKGAGEFDDFRPRAWLTGGDDLDEALEILETVHQVMLDRLGCIREVLGAKNMWHAGPSVEWPLIMTTVDECQSYFDLTMVKGDKDREPKVRRCIFLTSSLVRRGRSVGLLTVPATQKPTTDSLPSAIRDNCPLSLAFGLKTMDAAVATLGSSIRDYPSYSPVTLADPAYAGCCTATLKSGQDPFTRLRGPWITEADAARIAIESAHLRRDPAALLPVRLRTVA